MAFLMNVRSGKSYTCAFFKLFFFLRIRVLLIIVSRSKVVDTKIGRAGEKTTKGKMGEKKEGMENHYYDSNTKCQIHV